MKASENLPTYRQIDSAAFVLHCALLSFPTDICWADKALHISKLFGGGGGVGGGLFR